MDHCYAREAGDHAAERPHARRVGRSTFWNIWLGAPVAGVIAALAGALVARVRWWQPVAFALTIIVLIMLLTSPLVEMANACMTGSSQIVVGAVIC